MLRTRTSMDQEKSSVLKLAVICTHPIQYFAPVLRRLHKNYGIDVYAIYGSDAGVAPFRDTEFSESYSWDNDLVSGYESRYLSRLKPGEQFDIAKLRADGMDKELRSIKPDACLIVGYNPAFHRTAIFAALRQSLPVFFRGDVNDRSSLWRFPKSILKDAALFLFYRRCSKLLYVGRNAFDHYRRLGVPESKMIFSPHCVDDSVFQSDEASRSELRNPLRKKLVGPDSEKAFLVLFSGKLMKRKNPGLIIQACKLLPPELRRQIAVVFMGSGQSKQDLEVFSKREPEVRCMFTGFKNQKELSPYYHAADFLVLPSLHETWGLVVNDALHHGLPCIVSDQVGCAPDLIIPSGTGEVFGSGDAAALAEAMQRIIAYAGQLRTREACREIAARFSVEAAARGIAEACHSLRGSADHG